MLNIRRQILKFLNRQVEQTRIGKILKQWKDEAECRGVIQYSYSYSTNTLTIYTAFPGYLIGKGGERIDRYKERISNELRKHISIQLIETELEYID